MALVGFAYLVILIKICISTQVLLILQQLDISENKHTPAYIHTQSLKTLHTRALRLVYAVWAAHAHYRCFCLDNNHFYGFSAIRIIENQNIILTHSFMGFI